MSSELPRFVRPPLTLAESYAAQVFSHGEDAYLHDLIAYEDGHFRAVFRLDYFKLQSGTIEPSKSQWNTLKKRMKRINRGVFIFREHGYIESAEVRYGYVDFGFFAG